MLSEDQIGQRIKQFRTERGMKISTLAEKTGFSKGYLSKVENSKKSPPVSTLITLAKALRISVSEFFSAEGQQTSATLLKRRDQQSMVRMALENGGFGYSYVPLAHQFPKRNMHPYIVVEPPDRRSGKAFKHNGEEMIYMLEGILKFIHGDKEFFLEEGDCLYFDPSISHYGHCVGSESARCLVVIYSEEDK